jgi:hypothetical protein
MDWRYAIIAGLFIIGVLLAFPLAIGVCVAVGGILIGLDRFTARLPGFRELRRWLQRRQYRPGRVVTRFVARDVRRDVEVLDAAQIHAGIITARVRTWNVLDAAKRLAPVPAFGEVRTVEIRELWVWSGAPSGGPIPEEAASTAEPGAAVYPSHGLRSFGFRRSVRGANAEPVAAPDGGRDAGFSEFAVSQRSRRC